MVKIKIESDFVALVLVGLFFVIACQVAPFTGTVVEDATPPLAADSEWNKTYNTDLPEMSDVWGNFVTIIGAAFSLLAIFYAISRIIGKNLLGGN